MGVATRNVCPPDNDIVYPVFAMYDLAGGHRRDMKISWTAPGLDRILIPAKPLTSTPDLVWPGPSLVSMRGYTIVCLRPSLPIFDV